jgi:hypothetical protein
MKEQLLSRNSEVTVRYKQENTFEVDLTPVQELMQKIRSEFMNRFNKHIYPFGCSLGLTISKPFIEIHGGKMWIESQLGKATTIGFSLTKDNSTFTVTHSGGLSQGNLIACIHAVGEILAPGTVQGNREI